jgi:hypothetical protein
MEFISHLRTASGLEYLIDYDGIEAGKLQYVDRNYKFDYVPDIVWGCPHIRTHGNDKKINENDPCFSFDVAVPITVFCVYSDKLRELPNWMFDFIDTREKVTRTDSNTSTLKGIFTLFKKDFEPGTITLKGNLSSIMAKDADYLDMEGMNYCMYSVVLKNKSV